MVLTADEGEAGAELEQAPEVGGHRRPPRSDLVRPPRWYRGGVEGISSSKVIDITLEVTSNAELVVADPIRIKVRCRGRSAWGEKDMAGE